MVGISPSRFSARRADRSGTHQGKLNSGPVFPLEVGSKRNNFVQRKAANPRKVRANGDAALRQEAAQHALEVGIGVPLHQPKPPPGQHPPSFGDTIVQQQVQSLMQLNANLSSRIRDLEGHMEGLQAQMKAKEEKDRKKEQWFPSLVAFIVRNLSSKPLLPPWRKTCSLTGHLDLNAMDGAEQILTELNTLNSTFDNDPTLLNLDELLPPNLATSTSNPGVQTGESKPRVPVFPFMDSQMSNPEGSSWGPQIIDNDDRNRSMISGPSAPMLGLGNPNNIPMHSSLSGGNNMPSQPVDMIVPDYGNGETVMQMQQVAMGNGQSSGIDVRGKEVSGTKRNTMSNWTSSLSWTKAPRVLVVEDDAVS